MERRRRFRGPLLPVVVLLAVVAAACANRGGTDRPAPDAAGADQAVTGDLTVFAAASLTESFTVLGARFEARYPGTTVTFNFAGSSALVQQIKEGAPADVFASADEANMTKLTDAALHAAAPRTFADNQLELIVPPGNPASITGLADLARPGVVFVIGAPEVPVGRYAAQALQLAGVTVSPASYEENVKGVVTKVTSGEADAGIVYATDVLAAGDAAEGVPLPDDQNVFARYPIVAVSAAPNPIAAAAFVDLVTSADGERILATFGFRAP